MMRNVLAAAVLSGSCLIGAELQTNPPATQSRVHPSGARENVSDEQRAKLHEINEKFRTEQSAVYEKLRIAQRELEQTAQADVTDENAIRAKAAAVGQIEGDLAMLRAKHYKELRAVLPRDAAASQSGFSRTIASPRVLDAAHRSAVTNNASETLK